MRVALVGLAVVVVGCFATLASLVLSSSSGQSVLRRHATEGSRRNQPRYRVVDRASARHADEARDRDTGDTSDRRTAPASPLSAARNAALIGGFDWGAGVTPSSRAVAAVQEVSRTWQPPTPAYGSIAAKPPPVEARRAKLREVGFRIQTLPAPPLRIAASPVGQHSEATAAALLAPPDPSPGHDGRVMPLQFLGAFKCGTSYLYSALTKAAHVLPTLVRVPRNLWATLRDDYQAVGEVNAGPTRKPRLPQFVKALDSMLRESPMVTHAQKEFVKVFYKNQCSDATQMLSVCLNMSPRDSRPYGTRMHMAAHVQGWPEFKVWDLPLLVVDGSPLAGVPGALQKVVDDFEPDELARIRYVFTVKDPVSRTQSAHAHSAGMIPKANARVDEAMELEDAMEPYRDFDSMVSQGMEDLAKMRALCRDAQPAAENTVNAHACASTAADRRLGRSSMLRDTVAWTLLPGFYADALLYAFCTLVLAPLGEPCPAWDDPVIDGLMSPQRQSRVLVVSTKDATEDMDAVVDRVLAHAGLPLTRRPTGLDDFEDAGVIANDTATHSPDGHRRPSGLLHTYSNDHPHDFEPSPATLAALADLYREDDARLRRLMGPEFDPGYDLSVYAPRRGEGVAP